METSDGHDRTPRVLIVDGPSSVGGALTIQGSKNAAQKIIPMCALVPGRYTLDRVPLITDTYAVLRIIEFLGGTVEVVPSKIVVDTRELKSRPIPRSLTAASTGTFLFAGALLGRFGRVQIALPGGDAIGARPVDLHLTMFEALGAEVIKVADLYDIHLATRPAQRLSLPIPSAGVFVNAMQIAATFAGSTQLTNVPHDSDTIAAATFLETLGVSVMHRSTEGVGVTEIRGPCSGGGGHFALPPDRNDAATWLLAAAIAGGTITLKGAPIGDLAPAIEWVVALGAEVRSGGNTLTVRCVHPLIAESDTLVLGPSPRFHSDWGPFAEAALTVAEGTSLVEDRMYEGRYGHVESFNRLGAHIKRVTRPVAKGALMFDRSATTVTALEIAGPAVLKGADVSGANVRATAALALLAAKADGRSRVSGVENLFRGYEDFVGRLRSLGIAAELR